MTCKDWGGVDRGDDEVVDTLPSSLLTLLTRLILAAPGQWNQVWQSRSRTRKILRLKQKLPVDLQQMKAQTALQKHPQDIFQWQKDVNLPFMWWRQSTVWYDGSQLPLCRSQMKKSCAWIVEDGGGNFKIKCLPQSAQRSRRHGIKIPRGQVQQTLAQALHMDPGLEEEEDIVNYATTLDWLHQRGLGNRVTIMYCVAFVPKKLHVDWIEAVPGFSITVLEAFTGSQGTLVFAPYSIVQANKPRRRWLPMSSSPLAPLLPPRRSDDTHLASAVKIVPLGLTAAYFLNIVNGRQFLELCQHLDRTFGALWVQLDDQQRAVHLVYTDRHTDGCRRFNISPSREDDDAPGWNTFFKFLWQRHQALCRIKLTWLRKILQKMVQQFTGGQQQQQLSSPQGRCFDQLLKFTNKTRVVVFCPTDGVLHALKMPLADFAKQKSGGGNKFKGLLLKTDARHNLTSLSCSFLTLVNVAPLFGVPEKTNNFTTVAQGWLPPSQIFSLDDKDDDCRGRLQVNMLHEMYSAFCTFIRTKYLIDVYTWPLESLSSLSFAIVWLQSHLQGGPLFHCLEKTKSSYEEIYRGLSRGGFSWSCADRLSCGDPLVGGDGSEKARALVEYDICSSYGYAASRMLSPGGFCVGFDQQLQRQDGFRHRRFEFRGTFKFVRQLMLAGAGRIISVYSNYHALGIFCLGQYPLDLVVFTTEKNYLVQFDHSYTHGCPQGCRPLKRYAGGKT